MRKWVTVCILFIIPLFFGSSFLFRAYGQSGCTDLGAPLERKLTYEDISSPFNPDKDHYGIDYRAADGDNVLAVADGKIWKIGNQPAKDLSEPVSRTGLAKRGAGRYVVVQQGDGSKTLYAHLLEGSTNNLTPGMTITKGAIIGKADSTGGVTGPHLHLQYAPDGDIFNKASSRDPNPCIICSSQDTTPITIFGSDAPIDESQYSATGGTVPYTWTISKGSITQDGVVTVLGQCGTATITVTDACGTTQQKDIALTTYTYQIPISGPDAPTDGSQYTASGGIVPYTWSITKGSINTDGIVIVSGQCGTATITVKDKCDVTAEKVVTLPVVIGVSGPDAPVDGSQYTAITSPSGSNLNIQWSISKGSITQTGVVTVSGQCGAATVTATDACGNQGSKDVRMSGGTWVVISDEIPCFTSGWTNIWGWCEEYYDVNSTFYRHSSTDSYNPWPYSYQIASPYTRHSWAFGTTNGNSTCSQDRSSIPSWCTYNSAILLHEEITRFEWRCQ